MASAFDNPLEPSLCDQCGNATEATILRCSVRDSKSLCQDCFQDLPQARPEDIGDPEWVCDIHLNHKVDIFCETCQLGCCKECAVDVHKGHNVVNVFKLVEEIRRDLTEQLQKVGVRAERLSELRRTRKIESSLGKIEEAPQLLEKVVNEIKEEVAQNLEKDILRIQWETQLKIDRVKEQAVLDIQRIEEIQRGINTGLLEDAEKRRCKIQKAESKLLVGQEACESANLEIKSLLESTPEKLACRGKRFGSLIKASSAFQCQNGVLDCCREVEANLPKLKVEKNNFFDNARPDPPLVKFALYIFVVFYFAKIARGNYRDEYNRMLSSESMTSLNILLRLYFLACHALMCVMLMLILECGMCADYPITRKESFMRKLKFCIEMVQLGLWTVVFLILVNSSLYLFQSMGANTVYIISILQSCLLLYGMRHSKTFKDFCDYQNLHKF